MIPMFTFAGKTYSPYMFAALAGVLVTLFYTMHLAKKHGYDEIRVLYMLLLAFGFGLIGAHIMYGVVEWRNLVLVLRNLDQIDSFDTFIQAFGAVFGGAVYYGGIITAILVGYLYLRRSGPEREPYHDLGAVSIPLFHGFGRIGCFLAGCCYGVPWSCGITYHYALGEEANGVPRFPVQLAEAALNFLLFLFLRRLFVKGKMKGKLMNLYLIIYPIYRFLLEYLRGDVYRGFVGPFSTSQFVSLLLIVISAISLLLKRRRTAAEA